MFIVALVIAQNETKDKIFNECWKGVMETAPARPYLAVTHIVGGPQCGSCAAAMTPAAAPRPAPAPPPSIMAAHCPALGTSCRQCACADPSSRQLSRCQPSCRRRFTSSLGSVMLECIKFMKYDILFIQLYSPFLTSPAPSNSCY